MTGIKTLHQILILALGGATGTILRYYVYVFADKHLNHILPWGTIIVNLSGSFVIGFVWGLLERSGIPPAFRLFVFIGILGSFTTFSTFAFDSFNLLNQGAPKMMLLNILLNNAGGILLCYAGIQIARFFH